MRPDAEPCARSVRASVLGAAPRELARARPATCRALADRLHIQAEEEIAHGGVADHDDFVDLRGGRSPAARQSSRISRFSARSDGLVQLAAAIGRRRRRSGSSRRCRRSAADSRRRRRSSVRAGLAGRPARSRRSWCPRSTATPQTPAASGSIGVVAVVDTAPSTRCTTGSIGPGSAAAAGVRICGRRRSGANSTSAVRVVHDGLAGQPVGVAQEGLGGGAAAQSCSMPRVHLDDAFVAACRWRPQDVGTRRPALSRVVEEGARSLAARCCRAATARRIPRRCGSPACRRRAHTRSSPGLRGLRWLRQPNFAVHWSSRFL